MDKDRDTIVWRLWDIATLTCLLPHFLQLLTASGMDGVIGPPAQRLVAKGNRREGDLNHQQNMVELNAMANHGTQKCVTKDPVVSFTSNLFSLGHYGDIGTLPP